MGLLKCGECGCSLVPSHTRKKVGRLYRYYSCEHYRKGVNPNCEIRNVSANEIEALILSQLQIVFSSPEMIMETWREAQKDSKTITEREVYSHLHDLIPLWRELYPAEKQRILELIIEKIIVNYEFVDIRIRTAAIDNLAWELAGQDKRLEGIASPKLEGKAWINA
ncbi:zinc ribbon domain-containing protein [Bartonella queenslandensis]|uniref:zinc ribbon domain-containing protein n=1 Tax=Bartonella queenslandensis TaxID=481138 RepID=UPI001FD5740C|nr:zinc ribbon domain-containing protein [Bartonella queenslandensis]